MSQGTNKELAFNDPKASLSSWVIGRVSQWEEHRNTNYLKKWDEYYRISTADPMLKWPRLDKTEKKRKN